MDSFGGGQRVTQYRILGQPPAPRGDVDARQVLHHDRAGSEAEVPDLRVAYLVIREPTARPDAARRACG